MTVSKFDLAVGIIGAVSGVFGIGYAFGQRKKLNDISVKIDKSINELSADVTVDLSDAIVKKAIDEAVEKETTFVVRRAAEKITEAVEADISKQVRHAVEESYSGIEKQVAEETAKQVARIDIQSLKRQVVDQAKKDAAKKLDGCLDDILDDFNGNLKNVTHIYQSMAQVFPNGKEIKLSL